MSVRLDHKHGDKECFVIRSHHPLTKQGIFLLGGNRVTGAYMGYTGSWYFWHPESGEQIAQINSRFWNKQTREMVDLTSMVEAMRVTDLVPDPDCLVRP